MSDWLTGALTGGGSAGKASRTYGDAVKYALGLSSPYTTTGQNMYGPSMKEQKKILKYDWSAPLIGQEEAAKTGAANSLAREGLGGSGIASATDQAIGGQYADKIASMGIGIKEANLSGYSGLAQQAASNALNWAEFVNNMRLAQAGGAQNRSNQLSSYYMPLISGQGNPLGPALNAVGSMAGMAGLAAMGSGGV